ncbi:SDR family NAD(P)-dependent oxidoreductase [Microbacterium trichothecenolyticum]|uniref:2-dehydro-3-deoxy-D-gluconate 5-dehydrogenase n=1 Tax=Microbacterium trichothecenolyticum TaxID=69370 RepID=A0A0M2H720_MICTR|nr:SDR family NAD(P)-dependent oxidoreductase [Microbacterium trichothecenolyticum]KJL42319.1 2-dehydro-3-deoxy-D-gluconate 5-dehydrogenase [Microbacterium trichothecenolyticum]
MDLKLEGRGVIVTGASRGLGWSAARALADEGANVLAVGRSEASLQVLARGSYAGSIHPQVCDMRDRAQVAALAEIAVERLGRLDVVINNAGIAPAANFLEMDMAVLDETMEVNVASIAVLSQAAGRTFIAQGEGGRIVNIVSTSGILGKATLAAYSASKGAAIQLTKALAAEWARHDIQVNAIAPGAFSTEAQAYVTGNADILAKRVRKIPARRMAEPDEIGPLVCYLSSPLAKFVTGAIYVIDGGETAKQ